MSSLDPSPPITGPDDAANPVPAQEAAPSLARATLAMSVGTALSRLTGFGRIAVMAWAIGATESKLPDTYNLANSLPNIVYQLVLGEILATIFVPVFVEHIKTKNRDESWKLASSIVNIAFVIAAVFSAITVLLAPQLIKIYAFHVPAAQRAQQEAVGAFFLRIFMPQMIFYAVGAVMTGLLNAYRRFAIPMFAPVLNNVIVIATFVIFRLEHGTKTPTLTSLTLGDKWLLAGGTTLGVIAMTLVLVPFIAKLPGRYQLRAFQWRHPAIRHVGNLAKYSFGYVIVNQIGLWVLFALANGKQGGVTAFNNAWILFQLPYGIFAVSVMTYFVREISEHYVTRDLDAVRRDVSLGLRSTALIVLPASAGFIALSIPLNRLLLQHGTFSARSTILTADTFVLMSIGLGAFAAFQQLMRAFYAMQDTKTPWLVNVVTNVVNIATALPLYVVMGVPGLALSMTLSYVGGAVYGAAVLRSRINGIDGARLVTSHVRIGLASVATGLVAWVIAKSVGSAVDIAHFAGQLAQVGSAVLGGIATYLVAAKLLGVDELKPLIRMVSGRFRKEEAM
ncbi:MAG TPA: murein biosynthesis integral membrane protein MurJ [Actinomycetota bacterium]|nr:murein biosynthesis integral membrane protein MurJ [Actinomycetota bacterium]